jgi:glutamate-5-semialdehyde dehydrogenase
MTPADLQATVAHMGSLARAASRALAARLRDSADALVDVNAGDVAAARDAGLAAPLVERLTLDRDAIATVALGCEQIAAMPDPIGDVVELRQQPSGIRVGRMRVPIGVFAMVYESRPNVTIEAASLAIKSGNACILRGGSEALASNLALAKIVQSALADASLPPDAVQLVATTDRAAVGHLIAAPEAVDLVIPRGGKGLIERIAREAKVPVLKHLDGNCHVYVDADADLAMAVAIVDNAKTQKVSPCNAAESLLVHADVAADFLPGVMRDLRDAGVELRVDGRARAAAGEAGDSLVDATAEDWATEYLDLILAVKVVDSVGEAITHVNRYGSGHSEAIVTDSESASRAWIESIDAAVVYVNASTRFTDGGEFGMGAEIGNSTQKLHARGPIGLRELCTYKYVVEGSGQIRA